MLYAKFKQNTHPFQFWQIANVSTAVFLAGCPTATRQCCETRSWQNCSVLLTVNQQRGCRQS